MHARSMSDLDTDPRATDDLRSAVGGIGFECQELPTRQPAIVWQHAVVTMIAAVDGGASSPRPAPPPGRGGSAIENGLVCSNPDAAREGIVPGAQTAESQTRAADLLRAISKLRSSRPSVKFALRSRQTRRWR